MKKVTLFLIFSSAFFMFLPQAFGNLNDGLVAYYPFNGNANDESGNLNNGTVFGATSTADRFGNANRAYFFDGVNDYIRAPHSSSLDITGPITISSWIKTSGTVPNSGIIAKIQPGVESYPPGQNPPYYHRDGYLTFISDKNQYGCNIDYDWPYTHTLNNSETILTDGVWHHVLSVYDGVVLRTYVDGKIDVSRIYVRIDSC